MNGTTSTAASYLHRDALGSVRAITDAAGAKVESAFYKPFGEQTEWLSPAAPAPEAKGWIGERYDASAGLQYLNARYYDPELGMFIQPDWFEVTHSGVGRNRYSYSFNDPVNKRDPGGNLTIIVKGTGTPDIDDGYQPDSDFMKVVQETFGEVPVVLEGELENYRFSRVGMARELFKYVSAYEFAPGELLNIIGHSHGGNVIKEYTTMPDSRQIDNLITLGTPVRPDYVADLAKVVSYMHVYSRGDWIAPLGGGDHSMNNPVAIEFAAIAETLPGVKNVDATYFPSACMAAACVTRNDARQTSHGELRSAEIWRAYVAPTLHLLWGK